MCVSEGLPIEIKCSIIPAPDVASRHPKMKYLWM